MTKKFVSFDWVIKHMLRDKSNYVIVDGFLSELLKQDIKIQEILESEGKKQTPADNYKLGDDWLKKKKVDLNII